MHPPIRLFSACIAAALAAPAAAAGQPAAFSEAFLEFAAAVEGTFGDEGPRVRQALDRMTKALTEWDRMLAAAERQLDGGPPGAAARAERHIQAGCVYAQRGRDGEALRHLDAAARLDPQHGNVHVLRGLVLTRLGQVSDAADAFRRARTLDPLDPIANYHALHAAGGDEDEMRTAREALTVAHASLVAGAASEPARFPELRIGGVHSGDVPILPLHAYAPGYALLAQGSYDAAVAALGHAVVSDPLLVDPAGRDPAFRRAVGALRKGHLAEARALIEEASVRDLPESQRVLGLIRWAASDFDAAARHLEMAVRAAPYDERSRLALARVLESAGREGEARRVLQETTALFPGSAVAHWSLARSFERDTLFEQAGQAYQLAARGALGARSTLLQGIGRLGAAAADLPAALGAFAGAVASDANDPSAHLHLGAALQQQDRTDEAFAEFVAAALLDPREPRAHAGAGEIHLNAGRPEEAVLALRYALALSPGLTAARYALGTALTRLGRSAEAAQEFERVAREQRQALEDRRRTLALGVLEEEAALRAAEGDYERAAALWEQIVAREPDEPRHRVALGAALARAGRIDAAIGEYEHAVGLGAPPAALQQLEQLYARAGRTLDAARTRILHQGALVNDTAPQAPAR